MRALAVVVASLCALGCKSSAKHDAGADAGVDGGGKVDSGEPPLDAGVSVLEFHNGPRRSGVYLDPALTRAAVRGLHQDPSFAIALDGPTYAQPLFLDGVVGGRDTLLVATEQDVVALYDAQDAGTIWKVTLGTAVPLANLPCGNIDPLGITGTPYLELKSRTVYLDTMTTPDDGGTKKHRLFALAIDDGGVRPGWPIDLDSTLAAHAPPFNSLYQNQRGALALVDGVLYVPYGGHGGDCGEYHGWVVAVDLRNGNAVSAFSTGATGGGIWSPAGVTTDGTHLYVATGNTFSPSVWGGGDGVIKLSRGAAFSGDAGDYWAPADWRDLDIEDYDLGTLLPLDVPALTPSKLIAAFGKSHYVYLLDRENLGGFGTELTKVSLERELYGAATAYSSDAGTWLVIRSYGSGGVTCTNGGVGNVVAVKVDAGPSLSVDWCAFEQNLSIPTTSMSAPGVEPIVWTFGVDRLFAYDGETGEELFAGGGAGDVMTPLSYFNAPVIAKGKVYVAAKNQLYRFVP